MIHLLIHIGKTTLILKNQLTNHIVGIATEMERIYIFESLLEVSELVKLSNRVPVFYNIWSINVKFLRSMAHLSELAINTFKMGYDLSNLRQTNLHPSLQTCCLALDYSNAFNTVSNILDLIKLE